VRKVLYLSLKEFKTAQKRQLGDGIGDGTKYTNGEFLLGTLFSAALTQSGFCLDAHRPAIGCSVFCLQWTS
jgi:hypothetical protein